LFVVPSINFDWVTSLHSVSLAADGRLGDESLINNCIHSSGRFPDHKNSHPLKTGECLPHFSPGWEFFRLGISVLVVVLIGVKIPVI